MSASARGDASQARERAAPGTCDAAMSLETAGARAEQFAIGRAPPQVRRRNGHKRLPEALQCRDGHRGVLRSAVRRTNRTY